MDVVVGASPSSSSSPSHPAFIASVAPVVTLRPWRRDADVQLDASEQEFIRIAFSGPEQQSDVTDASTASTAYISASLTMRAPASAQSSDKGVAVQPSTADESQERVRVHVPLTDGISGAARVACIFVISSAEHVELRGRLSRGWRPLAGQQYLGSVRAEPLPDDSGWKKFMGSYTFEENEQPTLDDLSLTFVTKGGVKEGILVWRILIECEVNSLAEISSMDESMKMPSSSIDMEEVRRILGGMNAPLTPNAAALLKSMQASASMTEEMNKSLISQVMGRLPEMLAASLSGRAPLPSLLTKTDLAYDRTSTKEPTPSESKEGSSKVVFDGKAGDSSVDTDTYREGKGDFSTSDDCATCSAAAAAKTSAHALNDISLDVDVLSQLIDQKLERLADRIIDRIESRLASIERGISELKAEGTVSLR